MPIKLRASEVVIVKDTRKQATDVFEVRRFPVNLPWDAMEDIMGYSAGNILVDITGALCELERFKKMLVDIKDVTDTLANKSLAKQRRDHANSKDEK